MVDHGILRVNETLSSALSEACAISGHMVAGPFPRPISPFLKYSLVSKYLAIERKDTMKKTLEKTHLTIKDGFCVFSKEI